MAGSIQGSYRKLSLDASVKLANLNPGDEAALRKARDAGARFRAEVSHLHEKERDLFTAEIVAALDQHDAAAVSRMSKHKDAKKVLPSQRTWISRRDLY